MYFILLTTLILKMICKTVLQSIFQNYITHQSRQLVVTALIMSSTSKLAQNTAHPTRPCDQQKNVAR